MNKPQARAVMMSEGWTAYLERFCGGAGSKRPGPCPKGVHNAHIASGARLNAAKHNLGRAQARHEQHGTEATSLALSRARLLHTAQQRAHAVATKQAQAAGAKPPIAAGHLPKAKRASRALLTPEKRKEIRAKLAATNLNKKTNDSKTDLTTTAKNDTIPPVATKPEPEAKKVETTKIGLEPAARSKDANQWLNDMELPAGVLQTKPTNLIGERIHLDDGSSFVIAPDGAVWKFWPGAGPKDEQVVDMDGVKGRAVRSESTDGHRNHLRELASKAPKPPKQKPAKGNSGYRGNAHPESIPGMGKDD
jgi:hypothetical protein